MFCTVFCFVLTLNIYLVIYLIVLSNKCIKYDVAQSVVFNIYLVFEIKNVFLIHLIKLQLKKKKKTVIFVSKILSDEFFNLFEQKAFPM